MAPLHPNRPVGPVLATEGTGVYVSPFGEGFYVLMNRVHRHRDGQPVYLPTNADAIDELAYAFTKDGVDDYQENGRHETQAQPLQSDPVTGVCTWVQPDPWGLDAVVVQYFVVVRDKFHIMDSTFHTYRDYADAVADLKHAALKYGQSRFVDYREPKEQRLWQEPGLAQTA